jgi:membrane protease YdiL (CAAX protease family)
MVSLILLFVPVVSALPYWKLMIISGTFSAAGLVTCTATYVAMVLALMLMARRRGVSPVAFGCSLPRPGDLLLGVLGFLVTGLAVVPIVQSINHSLGTPMPAVSVNIHLSPVHELVAIFVTLILAPLCEEVLFRGFAIPRLMATGLGAFPAGALSLLAFAAIHLIAWGMGSAIFNLFVGSLFTALYLWRGNIAASLTMHVINDTFAFIFLPLLMSNH